MCSTWKKDVKWVIEVKRKEEESEFKRGREKGGQG